MIDFMGIIYLNICSLFCLILINLSKRYNDEQITWLPAPVVDLPRPHDDIGSHDTTSDDSSDGDEDNNHHPTELQAPIVSVNKYVDDVV